jgi:hypothetical protein
MRYERPAIAQRVKVTGPIITGTAPTSPVIFTPTAPDEAAP